MLWEVLRHERVLGRRGSQGNLGETWIFAHLDLLSCHQSTSFPWGAAAAGTWDKCQHQKGWKGVQLISENVIRCGSVQNAECFFFFLQEMFIEFRGRQWSFLFNWTYSGVGSCCLVMCSEGCELCLGLGWCILLQGTWVEGGPEVSVVGPFKWRGGNWVAGWTSLWTEIGLVLYLWPHYTKLSDTNPPGLLSAYCRPGPVLSTSMCHFSSQRNLSF